MPIPVPPAPAATAARWHLLSRRLAALIGSACVAAGGTAAANTADEPAGAPGLTELEGVLAQPVYGDGRSAGASKHTQDLEGAPAAVVVRTGGEIRAHGYRTLAEVLDSMPGIHLQYDRTYVYAGVRGIGRPGDFNSRLLVMIDGARINDALYDGGPLGLEFPLDVGLIDRVEYVPGPGSALYGSSAVLGVVNVITRTASQLPGLRSTVELGTDLNRKFGATWGGELAGSRVLLGYTAERRPGHDQYFAEYDTPETNHGLAQHQDGERATKLFGKARWTGLTLTAGASERTKDIPTGSYETVFNTSDPWTDRYAFVNADVDQRWGPDHELHARLGAERYQYRSHNSWTSDGAVLSGTEADDADTLSGEIRYAWLRWVGHRLTLGFEFQRNRRVSIQARTLAAQPEVLTDFDIDSSRHGFFVGDEWQVARSLVLNLGARADWRLDGRMITSPRLAAIWTPDPHWTFKWTQGSAFREPNAFERFYVDDTQRTNPSLKPESIDSRELAAIWRPAANFSLEASAYSFRITDLVELMTDSDGINVFRNRGELRSRGVDLTGTLVMAGGAQLRLSGSRQLAIDHDTGTRLSGAPQTLLKMSWTTPFAVPGLGLGVNGQYVGRRLTTEGAELGSYVRLNAHANYAPAGRPWSLALRVYNLGGERHRDAVGPELRQDSIRQDGREISLQLGWAF